MRTTVVALYCLVAGASAFTAPSPALARVGAKVTASTPVLRRAGVTMMAEMSPTDKAKQLAGYASHSPFPGSDFCIHVD